MEFISKKRGTQKSNRADTRKKLDRPKQVWVDSDGAVVESKGAKNAIPMKMKGTE